MITVVINTLTAFVNTARIKAKVRVIVQDKNDNEPEFFFNESYNKLVPSKYLAEVTSDTEVGTKVLQVIATDKDSGDYGKLKFEISPDTDKSTRKYFEIDPDNGLIVTKSDFKDTSEDDLPFRVIISVRDNPMNSEDSKMTKTELIVNLVNQGDLLVLSVSDTKPTKMLEKKEKLQNILTAQSELIVKIHQILPYMELRSNGTCCSEDPSSSDVWFYAISPEDQTILSLNDSVLKKKITGKMAATTLKYTVTGDLHVQASELRAPYMDIPRTTVAPTNATEVKKKSIFDGKSILF